MPVIRRWKQDRLIEDMEELFGAEMRPFLSLKLEEEAMEDPINYIEETSPDPISEETNSSKRFWSKLTTLFQSENW